jgi:7-carboxy-7-deazaguanine synthase
MTEVDRHGCNLVEVTGGEPLLQPNVHLLMSRLCDAGSTVLLETSGCIAVDTIDPRVIKIMDFKTPSSGEVLRNVYDNVNHLSPKDEVKFVIGDRADYDWTKDLIEKFELTKRCKLLVSPVFGRLDPQSLAEWILADRLPVRYQTQLHKIIWSAETRGV